MNKIIKLIRHLNWGILLICFFLPFEKGCIAIIETPYKTAFDSFDGFIYAGLPFLYPLLLLVGAYIFHLIRNETRKNTIAKILYFTFFYGITFLVILSYNAFYNEYLRSSNIDMFGLILLIIFVILWGIMGFGCNNLFTKNILSMLAFQISSLSACWIAFVFHMAEKRLIGAWISIIASGFIIITYVFNYLQALYINHRQAVKNIPKYKIFKLFNPNNISAIASVFLAIATVLLFLATKELGNYTRGMSLSTEHLASYEKYKTSPYMDVKIKSMTFTNDCLIPNIIVRNLSEGYVPDVYCGIRIIITESEGIKRRYGQGSIMADGKTEWCENLEKIIIGETYAPKEENAIPVKLKYNSEAINKITQGEWQLDVLVRLTYNDKVNKTERKYYYADYYFDHIWKYGDNTCIMRLKAPPVRNKKGEETIWDKDKKEWKNQG